MIQINRVTVTATVTEEDLVDLGDGQVVWITSVTVTYDRDASGRWVERPTVGIDAIPVDYIGGSVFTANITGHPPFLTEFIHAHRPPITT